MLFGVRPIDLEIQCFSKPADITLREYVYSIVYYLVVCIHIHCRCDSHDMDLYFCKPGNIITPSGAMQMGES